MPIQFNVASHSPNRVHASKIRVTSADSKTRCGELLQHSLIDPDFSKIRPERNGFVDVITLAYNEHHNLTIRPDDVWMAVLGQLNFYINAHAEDLRSQFVPFEGKKEIVVVGLGTRHTANFGALAHRLTEEMHKKVVDKELTNWILPNFTTTTHNDTVVCSVLMMATLSAYFNHKMVLRCGIPSITLEGEKADYEKLLARLDKLDSFGAEPKAWAALLRPIFTQFVHSFDTAPDVDFWSRICHVHPGGSGPSYLSGWVTAFCAWSPKGEWLGPSLSLSGSGKDGQKTLYSDDGPIRRLVLDGVEYPLIDTQDVPIGFCEVDVKLDDNGEEFDCMMVAGHLASRIEGVNKDSLRPLPTWFMFIKGSAGA
ncbi:hypothetical protein BDZ97DRAFT_1815253 [Flammula alnicola]|nr:hypothetical protein BDZ97DRAFT_1815253 [Flammula alnicola]